MPAILDTPITTPSAWHGSDLVTERRWQHRSEPAFEAALYSAMEHARRRDLPLAEMRAEDFPLGPAAAVLETMADELEFGRGFLLLKGLPVESMSEDDVRLMLYGLGLNLGVPVPQNPRGDVLGEVANVGDPNDKNTRVYQTNRYLPYHTDPSDVVGLLCLRAAKSGGTSALVSVSAVHNAMLERYPHYLGVFYRAFYYAHLGEDLPSLTPLFSFHQGKLAFRYLRQYIELGHEVMGRPLTAVESEAFDLFDALVQEPQFRLEMALEPGDLQFANNYLIMHSRNDFEDHPEPARRRKMLRLWLKMDNARALADDFPGRNGFPPAV